MPDGRRGVCETPSAPSSSFWAGSKPCQSFALFWRIIFLPKGLRGKNLIQR